MKQTTCCKILSPSGAVFFVLQSRPVADEASQEQELSPNAPLRFFSNLLSRWPLKTQRPGDGLDRSVS